MFFQLKSYLSFLIRSKNEHGIHSPFVFDLITKCFYQKTDPKKLKTINNYRNDLLQNNDFITVTDFGKGSRIFKSNHRRISKIAQVAGISKKKSKLLIRLSSYFLPKYVLEIGTSLGIGTASIALGNINAKITTLEGCPKTATTAQKYLKKYNFNNTTIQVGDFNKTLLGKKSDTTYDFIYFDGNHQKKPTLDYFEHCLQKAHNQTMFIFDDIYWSKEMQEAWQIIKDHPKVTVSIDTFYFGLIFFREEQVKEHFTIRV